MLTVVTGAAGFIGRAVMARMAATDWPGTVRLVDRIATPAPSAAFEMIVADLCDRGVTQDILADADIVIHLAALPGGAAEADPAASRRVNLEASLDLIDGLAAREKPLRLVYASTIAVLGAALPTMVDDATTPAPAMTYGAHKLMVEVALADAARRGLVDGIALRLPGIVARPRAAAGLKSAFMSDIFHAIAAGEQYVMPVGPDATMWLLSARACADALLHAARLGRVTGPAAMTVPALHVRMADLISAIGKHVRRDPRVIHRPDPLIEAQFGCLPPLATPAADALGFVHDGDLMTLVARAVAGA